MSRSDLHLVESAPLRYLLSLPPAPEPAAGAWPVLCFLHGYDEAAAGDRLYRDQGLDHIGAATFACQDDRIYSWLLAHELSAAPG